MWDDSKECGSRTQQLLLKKIAGIEQRTKPLSHSLDSLLKHTMYDSILTSLFLGLSSLLSMAHIRWGDGILDRYSLPRAEVGF